MTILVTGGTGRIGSLLLPLLAAKGADVLALSRTPDTAAFPPGVAPVKGDLLEIETMRGLLAKTRTLFLLTAVTPDELTRALLTLNLAHEAGVTRIVYLSVFNADRFTDVPHFTGKYAVERMIEDAGLSATILRPNYFTQNDAAAKEAVLSRGVYPQAIGGKGVSMVDIRDIAEAAAAALLARDRAADPLPREVIELVGPEAITGERAAQIWSEVLGRPIHYAGDDLSALEPRMAARGTPAWMARDLLLMMRRFQKDGMRATPQAVERLTRYLGHPPRSYRSFATEMAERWRGA